MDVTKTNFRQVLSEFKNSIETCDFIAIDAEFTGLSKSKSTELDDFEEYYRNLKNSIELFQVVQVGISLFKKIRDDKYDYYSYNFYIYPSKCIFLPTDCRERYFQCQSSSLEFLIENGLDFNKVIREGISYVPLNQLTIVKERIQNKVNETVAVHYIDIEGKEEDKKFVSTIMKQIDEFFISSNEELVLPQYNSYYRRLIHEGIQKSSNKNRLEICKGKGGSMIIRKAAAKSKLEQFNEFYTNSVGFSLIIELLIKEKKPIVGHSVLMDIFYIYNTFIMPLPDNYSEFKQNINEVFDVIYDTKFISENESIKNFISHSSLEKLNVILEKDPFLKTEFCLKNAEFNDNYNQYHQAGYDSFITGRCFINMIRFLCAQKFTKFENILDNNVTDQFKNKFAVYGNYFIKYLNLKGNDNPIKRKHVFHLKFPKAFQRNDIISVFSKYGGLAKIIWMDEETAFIILKNEDQASEVVKDLIVNRTKIFKVQCYSDYVKKINYQNSDSCNSNLTKTSETDQTNVTENNKKIKLDSTNNGMDLNEKLFEDDNTWMN